MVNPVHPVGDTDTITESILQAQRDAEEEANLLEAKDITTAVEEDPLSQIPRLLQQAQNSGHSNIQELVDTTQDLKAKGKQLDLLLLKAETYSHFIRQNQQRTKEKLESIPMLDDKKSNKRKAPQQTSAKAKRTKNEAKETTSDSEPSHHIDHFEQPSTLVGGTLMSYQLEGLKWLLSLWENGLSGILAGKNSRQLLSLRTHVSAML